MSLLQEGNIREMYNETRGEGLNSEVKRRILMGTYALSAGYYDAYYKRAQQVRTSDCLCCVIQQCRASTMEVAKFHHSPSMLCTLELCTQMAFGSKLPLSRPEQA